MQQLFISHRGKIRVPTTASGASIGNLSELVFCADIMSTVCSDCISAQDGSETHLYKKLGRSLVVSYFTSTPAL
jgi:hypothetical protein